jgi:hypothetical protein
LEQRKLYSFKREYPAVGPALTLLRIVILICGLFVAEQSTAGAGERQEASRFMDRFEWDLRLFAFGVHQQPANSTQNPSNHFLNLPYNILNFEARPDLRLDLGRLELSAKPRLRLNRSGAWDDDCFVNEWLARFKLRDNLFISYGRENLQWGPSFLFSPSNPFFPDNGRRGFYSEVPGMDFGRIIWVPSASWSVSFIANVGEGASEKTSRGGFASSISAFEKTYAIKADFTGRQKYASLIFSRNSSESALGFFGGWTASDALLLYGEGMISRGSHALYPIENKSQFGPLMERIHAGDSSLYPAVLAGASYTFQSKGALTAEYAYYGPGYSSAESDRYYALRNRAASVFESGGAASLPAGAVLYQTASTGLRFLRRNYSMVQYVQSNIRNRIGVTLRWTQSLDEKSGQIAGFLSCTLGKHMELFSIWSLMPGKKSMEFNSLLERQVQLGAKYSF